MNILRRKLKNIDIVVMTYDMIRQKLNALKFRISERKFIEKIFYKKFGYKLDLDNPQTFNEKLNWMKLYWHNPLLTKCIDKYIVRQYLTDIGYGYLLTDLYGVYNDIDEVDFKKLPNQFVLKMNNGSGCNIICKNKNNLNINEIKRKFKREMKRNYYYTYGEWGYKNIKPKIICEELIHTDDGKPPKDYKIFCFHGKPYYLYMASDRVDHQTKFDFYTIDWEWIPVKNHYPNAGDVLERPECLEEMLDLARKLSKPFPEVRLDFYYENGKIIFGEFTFYHMSAFTPFDPYEFDIEMGSKFELPKKYIEKR